MQSGDVEKLNSRLCKIEYQIDRLSKLPECDRVEKHIRNLTQRKDSLTKTIESYSYYGDYDSGNYGGGDYDSGNYGTGEYGNDDISWVNENKSRLEQALTFIEDKKKDILALFNNKLTTNIQKAQQTTSTNAANIRKAQEATSTNAANIRKAQEATSTNAANIRKAQEATNTNAANIRKAQEATSVNATGIRQGQQTTSINSASIQRAQQDIKSNSQLISQNTNSITSNKKDISGLNKELGKQILGNTSDIKKINNANNVVNKEIDVIKDGQKAQKKSIESNRNESMRRSRNIQYSVYNNDSRITGLLNHFDTTPLQTISKDIKDIVTPEFEKTIHIFSGKPNYRGEYFEDVDVKDEKDKEKLKNIDKVLRDLHFFNLKKYKEISNEFPKRPKSQPERKRLY